MHGSVNGDRKQRQGNAPMAVQAPFTGFVHGVAFVIVHMTVDSDRTDCSDEEHDPGGSESSSEQEYHAVHDPFCNEMSYGFAGFLLSIGCHANRWTRVVTRKLTQKQTANAARGKQMPATLFESFFIKKVLLSFFDIGCAWSRVTGRRVFRIIRRIRRPCGL